jgi:hypothetical protein
MLISKISNNNRHKRCNTRTLDHTLEEIRIRAVERVQAGGICLPGGIAAEPLPDIVDQGTDVYVSYRYASRAAAGAR